MPTALGSVVLLAPNSALSLSGVASRASNLLLLIVRDPSRCTSRPASDRREMPVPAIAACIVARSWRCMPITVLLPCSGPAALEVASYFV